MYWLLLLCLAQEPAAPKATLRGTILDQASGTPLAEARVTIRLEQAPTGQTSLNSSNEKAASTRTDASGAFTLEAPVGLPFHLSVTHEGHIAYGDQAFRSSESPTLRLEAGESKTLAPIRLSSGAILAGRLTDRESGKPIAGITVTPLLLRPGGPTADAYAFPIGKQVISDSDGRFSLPDLPSGEYRLQLDASLKTQARTPKDSKPSAAAFGYPMLFYPGVREYSQALSIQVSNGARLEYLDMKLEKVRTYRLRGVLHGEADKNAWMVWTLADLGWGTRMGPLGKLEKLGPFEIVHVYPGAHRFSFWASAGEEDPRRQQANLSLDVLEDVEDLDVNLAYGFPLQVTVEPPLPAELRLSLQPQERIGSPADRIPPFPGDQPLRVENVFAERLRISLSNLPKAWIIHEIRYNGTAIEPMDFQLNPLLTDHKLVIAVQEVQNGIRGRVKPGHRVVAARAPLAKHDTDARARKTTADENGDYHFSQLNPGKWYVLQIAPTQSWASGLQLLKEGKGELCEVAAKATCSLSPREP